MADEPTPDAIDQSPTDSASCETDGLSAAAQSIPDVIQGADRQGGQAALTPPDRYGGIRSAWGCTRPGEVIPPGCEMPTVLELARAYAAGGLSIIPISLDGLKHPYFSLLPSVPDPARPDRGKPTWKVFQERPPTDEELRKWFSTDKKDWAGRRPLNEPAAIGVVCGAVSSGLEVLDFDQVDVAVEVPPQIFADWPDLAARLVLIETGRGGLHIAYRCPEIAGNQELALRPATAEELAAKPREPWRVQIETRGEGGYIVAPGSPLKVHASGRPYRHLRGNLASVAEISPEERSYLLRLCRSFDCKAAPPEPNERQRGPGLSPPEDFDRRGPSWESLVVEFGGRFASGSAEEGKVCRPGKERGYGATAGFCKGKAGEPLLHVFTSSWSPLEAGKCYGKYHFIRLLKFDGDGRRAWAWCREQGYGSKPNANASDGDGKHHRPAAEVKIDEPEPWDPPIPLEDSSETPTPFPLHCLPDGLAQLAAGIAEAVNTQVDLPAVMALGLAAGSIGATMKLEIKPGRAASASLYVCLVASKGSGKTPAASYLMPPLIEEQVRRRREDIKIPAFVEDVTVEKLKALLQADPRGQLMIHDEMASWFKGFDQYKAKGRGTDRQFFLSVWAGHPVTVNRRNPEDDGVFVPHPCLSVVGGIQPAVLTQCRKGGDDDGLFDRILFSFPAERPPRGECWLTVDTDLIRRWDLAVKAMRNMQMTEMQDGGHRPFFVNLTEDGRRAWEDWTNWLAAERRDPEFPEWLKGPAIKMEDNGARIALVIHLLREAYGEQVGRRLDAESLNRGAEIGRYFMDHARRAYLIMGRDPRIEQARRVLEWIQKREGESFRRSDIWETARKSSTFAKPEELNDPLYLLEQHRFVRRMIEEKPKIAGRPATVGFIINPLSRKQGDQSD